MRTSGRWSQRLAVFLTSAVVIVAELALMRELALRFWEHLAWLAISICLLGFGVSGTMLVLIHHCLQTGRQTLQRISLIGLGISLPACVWLADTIEMNPIQMVWQPALMWTVGALELILGIPFVFGGMFIGLTLQDQPDRMGGHYAASFLGSGVGGIVALPLLFIMTPRLLIISGGCAAMAAALLFVDRTHQAATWLISTLILAGLVYLAPNAPRISEDKDIVQILAIADSISLSRQYGPQGVIELVEAPAYHTAPGLALSYSRPVPQQTLIVIDGQVAGSFYTISSFLDFAFMNYTTMALPYTMTTVDKVLIDNGPGVDQVGLALFHGVEKIAAVTPFGQLAEPTMNELPMTGTNLYTLDQVDLAVATLRQQLRTTASHYSLIVLPTTGTDPAGLAATEPDSRMTIDAVRLSFSHLAQNGLLSWSTAVHQPPRESLRLLNMLAEVLLENDLQPAAHIAMIRNWSTLTVVAARSPLTADQLAAIRLFSLSRGFDLVWLPDLKEDETNRFHLLETDDYWHGAKALLTGEPRRFIARYLYDLSPPDDNKPFFNHFKRQAKTAEHPGQSGRYGRSQIELGSFLLSAALLQATVLALTFIVLPLVPVIGLPGGRLEQIYVLGFFSSLGFGFMLLEIGLLQRLTVYLAHPLWASATVISGFMFFGGVGSALSSMISTRLVKKHAAIIGTVIGMALFLPQTFNTVSELTEGLGLVERIAVSYTFIAPLAMGMGMVFPTGLKRLGSCQPKLIPWAWSANGFSSVLATLLAQIMAMRLGFDAVVGAAIGCYGLTALCSLKLPGDSR